MLKCKNKKVLGNIAYLSNKSQISDQISITVLNSIYHDNPTCCVSNHRNLQR